MSVSAKKRPGPPHFSGPPGLGGFTVLELAMYVSLLALIGLPLVSALLVSARAVAEGDTFASVAERNRMALFRMGRELRKALSSTLSISADGRTLTFTLASGVGAGGPIPGPEIEYRILPEAGETIDGADNDGDGLVDEGRLRRRDLTAGTAVVLSGMVAAGQSSFSAAGSAVTVTLTHQGKLAGNGNVFQLSRSITVYPRN